jgi:hypothetical protein
MKMTSKGESPRERPRPRPRPRQKLLQFVNEVIPFLTSCPSSPRLRMNPTKGNVDMHFEKISIEVDPVGHDLFQEMFTGIKAGYQIFKRSHAIFNISYIFATPHDTSDRR